MTLAISKHAEQRVKERLGLPKKAIKRLPTHIEQKGLRHQDTSGNLHKWMTRILLQNSRPGTTGIIYNNGLFLINNETIITVIPVPASLHHAVKIDLDKRQA